MHSVAQSAIEAAFRVYRAVNPASRVTRNGVVLGLRDPGISAHMFAIIQANLYEKEEVGLVRRHLTSADRVLECGSAIGYLSLLCLRTIGCTNVAMVEANPALHKVIAANFERNGLKLSDYPFFGLAVAPTAGTLEFGVAENFWASSLRRTGQARTVVVETRTMVDIIAMLPFAPNTLIMDIEGAEVDLPTEHFAPFEKIIIEIHPAIVGKDEATAFITRLTTIGFSVRERVQNSLVLSRV